MYIGNKSNIYKMIMFKKRVNNINMKILIAVKKMEEKRRRIKKLSGKTLSKSDKNVKNI